MLLDALPGTDFRVVIIGSGPVERELRAQAERLKLTNVDFVGPVGDDDKIALLTLCHALTFPSHLRSEAFGISLLEAAMFGKPMISTEIGTGTSYVNVDGETGLVVPASDPGLCSGRWGGCGRTMPWPRNWGRTAGPDLKRYLQQIKWSMLMWIYIVAWCLTPTKTSGPAKASAQFAPIPSGDIVKVLAFHAITQHKH